jgi:hypothetical protein
MSAFTIPSHALVKLATAKEKPKVSKVVVSFKFDLFVVTWLDVRQRECVQTFSDAGDAQEFSWRLKRIGANNVL